MEKIRFVECSLPGYKARTVGNASAQMTIAIAVDFTTLGERATKKAVDDHEMKYIPVNYNQLNNLGVIDRVAQFISVIQPKDINIAGNGIYSLPDPQNVVDEKVFDFLSSVFILAKYAPNLIRSGGQSGIDEAGLKAASLLKNVFNISALCYAPKGWVFRDKDGYDIMSETRFKERFKDYL